MNGQFVFVLCVFVASSLFVNKVTSECCYANKNWVCTEGCEGSYTKCGDDSNPTPYCGLNTCNIFGCDCGGCRTGKNCPKDCPNKNRMGALNVSSDGFGQIDSNRDGRVSLDEAMTVITGSGKVPAAFAREEFARMDLDFDGFLSREEID